MLSAKIKIQFHLNRILLLFILTELVIPLNASRLPYNDGLKEFRNSYFIISFDKKTGIISVEKANGFPLISGAISAVNTKSGIQTSLVQNFNYSLSEESFSDEIGSGRVLKILGRDKMKKLDFEVLVSLYNNFPGILFETIVYNVSAEDIIIRSIEPLRIIKEESGSLFFKGLSKCLTNGAIYYDAGHVCTFGDTYVKPERYGEIKGGIIPGNDILSDNKETIQSWWNAGLFSGYDKEGMSLGYIESRTGFGRLLLLKTGEDELSFVAATVFNPGFELKHGHSISSGRFLVNIAADSYRSLEDYASILGKVNKGITNSIINGWCNWFYTLDHFTEEEIIKNAEFASKNLKQYGLEYIQIDEGYQTLHGEWQGNSRFPHGLRWFCSEIKNLGLKPGIWISPFVVSETADIFKQHPEWFLKKEDGSFMRVGPWPDENTDWFKNESPKRYGLDITNPGAEKWFTDLIDTIVNNWGFEMIKIDFVAWSVLSAYQYWDPSYTQAQVYRKAFEIIRKTAGDKCHLLDCGPGNITAGLINSMRVEYDQNYGYGDAAWGTYFTGPSCSADAAGYRYYFHNKAWINDADHICVDMLSFQQSQAVASLIALTGGNTMSGDRLLTMDKLKLEIIRKIFPSSGINARPVDLWDSKTPAVFAASVKKDFGEWTVAAFFNPDMAESVIRRFPVSRLWLDPGKTYLCWDFWKEQFLGEIKDSIFIKTDPGSVTLLSLNEKKDVPQVISTTRHVMQGAVETENITFNSSSGILSGVSIGPEGDNYSVIVYIPDSYDWWPKQTKLYDDFENYSVKKTDYNILRIQLNFKNTTRIQWSVEFEKTE
jgi:hypothetical protein